MGPFTEELFWKLTQNCFILLKHKKIIILQSVSKQLIHSTANSWLLPEGNCKVLNYNLTLNSHQRSELDLLHTHTHTHNNRNFLDNLMVRIRHFFINQETSHGSIFFRLICSNAICFDLTDRFNGVFPSIWQQQKDHIFS